MRFGRGSFGIAVLLTGLLASNAAAQSDSDRATARQLAQQGQTALDAKDYKRAEDSFRRADALFHAPTLTLGLARAQAAEGKFVESWESYQRIILDGVRTTPVFAKALDDATREIATVDGRRARVTVNVTGADRPVVTIDDLPIKSEALGVERFVDPGTHAVKASADGYKSATQSFAVAEGKAQTVSLTLQPAAASAVVPAPSTSPAAPLAASLVAPSNVATPTQASADSGTTHEGSKSSRKTVAFVAFGLGAAGLVVGGVAGALALGKHSDLATACPGGNCTSDHQSDVDSYHSLGMISTIGFIVGGVGVAAGAILYFTAPKAASQATTAWISPYVGPGTVGAAGRF